MESRTKNSIKNSTTSVITQIISIILSFAARTFFIRLLNEDYLGVNGLFTNILTLLSLAELGVGSAIIYMMYEPVAKGNVKKISAYMGLYKKVYTAIGFIIFAAGFILVPFLDSIIKDVPDISENLRVIYVMFLANTSISYFFTYKRSLITAHQKQYINSQNEILFAFIKDIVQIVVLFLWRNYYLYLLVQIITTLASNIAISVKADKLFPEVKKYKNELLLKSEKRTILKNTVAMMSHKIGSVIVTGTDSILISMYVSIGAVGIYSNYKMISTYLRQIVNRGINAVTASVGNLVATSDNDKVYSTFKRLYFVNYLFAFYISVGFYALSDAFITVWIGKNFLLDEVSILIIAANLFFNQIREPAIITINTYGLFWNIKWKSIIEAMINLVASVVLARFFNMGITGILLGTLISNLSTNIWWEPLAAFKYGMKKSVKKYYLRLVANTAVVGATIFVLHMLVSFMDAVLVLNPFVRLIVYAIVSMSVATIIFVITCGMSAEFKYLIALIKSIVGRLLKK